MQKFVCASLFAISLLWTNTIIAEPSISDFLPKANIGENEPKAAPEGATGPRQEYLGSVYVPDGNGPLTLNVWGQPDISLGTKAELRAVNKNALACLEKISRNSWGARIVGVPVDNGAEKSLDPSTLTCKPIKGEADCPDKKMAVREIEGAYMGVECGDFCYLTIRLDSGESFTMLADEEEIHKLFGKKTGIRVSVSYSANEGWLPEGGGFCSAYDVFESGKVIK